MYYILRYVLIICIKFQQVDGEILASFRPFRQPKEQIKTRQLSVILRASMCPVFWFTLQICTIGRAWPGQGLVLGTSVQASQGGTRDLRTEPYTAATQGAREPGAGAQLWLSAGGYRCPQCVLTLHQVPSPQGSTCCRLCCIWNILEFGETELLTALVQSLPQQCTCVMCS